MDDVYGTERRWRDFVEIAGDFTWEIDSASRFVFAAPRLVFGWPAQALVGRKVEDFLADPGEVRRFAVMEPASCEHVNFRAGHGATIGLSLWARPVFDSAGVWNGARGIGRDAADLRTRDVALNEARQREGLLRHVTRSLRDEPHPEAALAAALAGLGLAIGAAGGAVLRAGPEVALRPAASWGAKTPPAALVQLRAALAERRESISVIAAGAQVVAQAVSYRGEIKGLLLLWRRGEGASFGPFDCGLLAEAADHFGAVLVQIEARERIEQLARTDHLTALVNRGAFFEEFARRLGRLDRGAQAAALLFIDVINLRLVNAARGPSGGDAALVSLAAILRDHSRAGDLIARFSGAEFALWIEGIDPAGARVRAEALADATRCLADLSGSASRPFGIRVGVAHVDPARPEGLLQLIARAAAEAARAKQQGGEPLPASLSA